MDLISLVFFVRKPAKVILLFKNLVFCTENTKDLTVESDKTPMYFILFFQLFKMVVDFDVLEFCKKLKNSKAPPYQCPVAECGRTYRSLCGMQYHLMNFDHNNPAPILTPGKHKKKGRIGQRPPSNTTELLTPVIREVLTYAEAQKIVEFEIDGRAVRVEINEPIPVISKQEYDKMYFTNDSRSTRNNNRNEALPKLEDAKLKLPEPSFIVLDSYNIPDAPPRPNSYIR